MTAVFRSWPALFAWGAGLLHIALAAEALRHGAGAGVVVAVLVFQGAGELTWGIVRFTTGRAAAPRVALAGAMSGAVLAGVAIGVGGSPIAAAVVILLVVPAALLTWSARGPSVTGGRPWAPAIGVVVGSVLVAALVTPALSTTTRGGVGDHDHLVFVDPHAGH